MARLRLVSRVFARVVLATLASAATFAAAPACAGVASDELVRQARVHEASHEDDLAVRRYSEALQLDSASADAYLGLGAIRLRLGDAREAERVYSTALDHLPGLRAALLGRARARWAVGHHDDAEQDLESYAIFVRETSAWRDLAGWYGEDGKTPAQLATWRRVLTIAAASADAGLTREARAMVRALQLLIGPADPAISPPDAAETRRALALIARRAG